MSGTWGSSEIALFLATVIDKEIAVTDTSFMAFGDIYWRNGFSA